MTTVRGWDVTVENCNAYDTLAPEKQAEVIEMAVDFLWNWTGQVYGVESVTVRPCRETVYPGIAEWSMPGDGGGLSNVLLGSGAMRPALIGGEWFNLGCGAHGFGACGCNFMSEMVLPGPISSIDSVQVGATTLDPSAYRVDNGKYLVRTDGDRWPVCQDMAAPPGDPDTFLIAYKRGIPVPKGGLRAAATLACQFAKAINQPSTCQLPQRIREVTRQGVTVTLMDDFKTLPDGGTGIWMIDSWVLSVTKARQASTVRSPDLPHPKRRTTTWGG